MLQKCDPRHIQYTKMLYVLQELLIYNLFYSMLLFLD